MSILHGCCVDGVYCVLMVMVPPWCSHNVFTVYSWCVEGVLPVCLWCSDDELMVC